jgi:hypothetical protein
VVRLPRAKLPSAQAYPSPFQASYTKKYYVVIRPKMLVLGKAAIENFEDAANWLKVYRIIGPTIETGDIYVLQELGALLYPGWVAKTPSGNTVVEWQAVELAKRAIAVCRAIDLNEAVAPYAVKQDIQVGARIIRMWGYTNIPNRKAFDNTLRHYKAIQDGIEEHKQKMLDIVSKPLRNRVRLMERLSMQMQLELSQVKARKK